MRRKSPQAAAPVLMGVTAGKMRPNNYSTTISAPARQFP